MCVSPSPSYKVLQYFSVVDQAAPLQLRTGSIKHKRQNGIKTASMVIFSRLHVGLYVYFLGVPK
eukprot:m.261532 g.261532  ORF g.261532 m.261532 type:complete len:64 (+) comp42383_c0_seq1:275-466(+)